MTIFTNISPSWQGHSEDPDSEYAGVINVKLSPPSDLSNLDTPDYIMRYDVVIVHTDNIKRLKGKKLHWDNLDWTIDEVDATGNGTADLWISREMPPHLQKKYSTEL